MALTRASSTAMWMPNTSRSDQPALCKYSNRSLTAVLVAWVSLGRRCSAVQLQDVRAKENLYREKRRAVRKMSLLIVRAAAIDSTGNRRDDTRPAPQLPK